MERSNGQNGKENGCLLACLLVSQIYGEKGVVIFIFICVCVGGGGGGRLTRGGGGG